MKIVKEAIEKNIVSVQESLSNDKVSKTQIARQLGYDNAGYLFGMEDSFANFFIDLVGEYTVIHSTIINPENSIETWFRRADNTKGQILSQLIIDPVAKRLWREFSLSNEKEHLRSDIISEINT